MSSATPITMFWMSFWLYFVSFLLFVVFLAFHSRLIGWLAAGSMFAGFVPHTYGLAQRWVEAGHLPVANMYEYANLMSWMSVAIFAAFVTQYRRLAFGAVISSSVIIIMVVASVLPKTVSEQLVPAIHGCWLTVHVTLAAVAEGAFAVAFSVGLAYLLIARRASKGSPRRTLERFPKLRVLDEANFKAIAIGYPLFTIGALFAGSVWALETWGAFWAWEPKEISALAIWLFYSAYLYVRLFMGWRGSKTAWFSIVGFSIVLLSFLGNIFLGGRHTYG